ncbi:MAG: hypothetical protein ACRDRY_10405 [Pseudonocardiaceae bacterium]
MSQDPGAVTTSEQLDEANRFSVTGPIVISYFRTSFTGVPQFSYKDGELDLNFSGGDIAREDTPLGEIVTVRLENVVDAFVRTFTLLVPKIRLCIGDPVSFDTLGIETIDRSGAFVPPPGPAGVLQTYRSHQLQGVAEFVIP